MSSTFLEIGERLRKIRASTGLTQEEFAEVLGTSYRSYNGYEKGRREVPTHIVLKLHEWRNISPLWLLTGETTELDEASLDIVGDAIRAGLNQLDEKAPNRANADKSGFLKLIIKLSLKQRNALPEKDIGEMLSH